MISAEEMVEKIRAAAAFKKDKDFFLNIREAGEFESEVGSEVVVLLGDGSE